jgi:hypothetical protein
MLSIRYEHLCTLRLLPQAEAASAMVAPVDGIPSTKVT